MCPRAIASGTAQSASGSPCEKASPALVVASALKPRYCRYFAVPMSHGLGMTKQPVRCSSRKAARRSMTSFIYSECIAEPSAERIEPQNFSVKLSIPAIGALDGLACALILCRRAHPRGVHPLRRSPRLPVESFAHGLISRLQTFLMPDNAETLA